MLPFLFILNFGLGECECERAYAHIIPNTRVYYHYGYYFIILSNNFQQSKPIIHALSMWSTNAFGNNMHTLCCAK